MARAHVNRPLNAAGKQAQRMRTATSKAIRFEMFMTLSVCLGKTDSIKSTQEKPKLNSKQTMYAYHAHERTM